MTVATWFVSRARVCRRVDVWQLVEAAQNIGGDDPAFLNHLEMLMIAPQEALQQIITSLLS